MSESPRSKAVDIVQGGWRSLLDRSRVYKFLNAVNFLLALLAFLGGFLPTAAILGFGGAFVSLTRIGLDVYRNAHRDPIDVIGDHGGGPVGRTFVGGAALGVLLVRPGSLTVALAVIGVAGAATALVLVAGVPAAVHWFASR